MAVRTIKPAGGGNHISLAAWATFISGTAGAQDAECYVGNCGSLTVNAWTPSSSEIYAEPGARHTGVDNGTAGLATSPNIFINIGASWTVRDYYLTGRIVLGNGADGVSQGDIRILERCIISSAVAVAAPLCEVNLSAVTSPGEYVATVRNNVIRSKTTCTAPNMILVTAFDSGGGGTSITCLIVGNTCHSSASISPDFGIDHTIDGLTSLVLTQRNNAVFGNIQDYNYAGTGYEDPVVDHNASSDGSATGPFSGTGDLLNQVDTDWFNGSPTDFSLKLTAPGFDAGIEVGTGGDGFHKDIIATARPQGAAFDIGAFERLVAGGGGIGRKIISWLSVF